MTDPKRLQPGQVENLQALAEYQDGSIVSRTLLKEAGGSLTLFAFDVGQALSEHTSPFDAVVQVLHGSAEVVIGGDPVIVGAGESVLMPGGVPHAVNAPERFKMLLVMIRP